MNTIQCLIDLKREYLDVKREYAFILSCLNAQEFISAKDKDAIDNCEDVLQRVNELIAFIDSGIKKISKNN